MTDEAGRSGTQEFFTVDQVATMLEMTPRTVRTFIGSRELRAAKLGGEWRIHRDDLRQFLDSKYPEPEGAERMNSAVKAFIDGEHMEIEGRLQICTVVDLYEEDRTEAEKVRDRVWDVVNAQSGDIRGEFRGEWHYIEDERKARFVLWARSPEYLRILLAALPEI